MHSGQIHRINQVASVLERPSASRWAWHLMFGASMAMVIALSAAFPSPVGRDQAYLILSLAAMAVVWLLLGPGALASGTRKRWVPGALLAMEALLLAIAVLFNANASYAIIWLAALGYALLPLSISVAGVILYEVLIGAESHYLSVPAVPLSEALAWILPVAISGSFIATFVKRLVEQRRQLTETVVELHNAQGRLSELYRQIGERRERERIAERIHESIAQQLIGILLVARGADAQVAGEELKLIASEAETALEAARRLINGIDGTEERITLADVLEVQAARLNAAGLRTEVAVCELPDLGEDQLECLAVIAREAVTNILKHARASCASISLVAGEGGVELRIDDDGAGFADTGAERPDHFGLRLMRHRVEQSFGVIEVSSSGSGTQIAVRLPV